MKHRTIALLLGLLVVLGALAAPGTASADVKGKSMQSANIQATPGHQLDSDSVKAVYCHLAKDGYNHVTFNPVLIQDTPTSAVIDKRGGKQGVEPTATDAQFRRAIRNAKDCGLKVVIKPHLELKDGSWRAKIVGTQAEFEEWTGWLLKYQQIGLQEGNVDTLVIGVEQKNMTNEKEYTARWLKLISKLRAADPQKKIKLTYAAHTGDELILMDKTWVKKLDFVCATWYPRIDKRGFTYTSMKKKMAQDKGEFDKAWKRYRKPLQLCETGIRSLEYDHRFAKAGTQEYADAQPDQRLQEVWYHAMLHSVDGWDHFTGVHVYRVTADPEPKDFSPKEAAEKTIKKYFE